MKTGQLNTTFGILVIALSFVMMIGVFVSANVMKSTATKTIDNLFADTVTNKVLLTLVEMKVVINTTAVFNFTRTVSIPPNIGDKTYVIIGKGQSLEIRTLDKQFITKQTNISVLLPHLNLTGATGSSGGKLSLSYFRGINEIRIS